MAARRLSKWKASLIVGSVMYICVSALPSEWLWFDPGAPVFENTVVGKSPPMTYSRKIYRQTSISYTVIVREAITQEIICEAIGGPFDYLPAQGPVVGKTLKWWAPSDPRCGNLPVGTYWAVTKWKLETPLRALFLKYLPDQVATSLGWLIPPKTVIRESLPFTVHPRNEGP